MTVGDPHEWNGSEHPDVDLPSWHGSVFDPVAELDPIERLRIITGGIPGARVVEGVVDVPFDEAWAVMGDLEDGFGVFQPDMRHVTVVDRDGEHVVADARSRYGMRARLRGVLRPGWCWLQSRFVIIGMAATPSPDGATTRVALTGGVRVPGRAAIVPLGTRRALQRSLTKLDRVLTRN